MSAFERIATVENDIEAGLVEAVLKEQGIPFILRSHYDTAYDGLYQTQKGWGELLAPPRFRKEIQQILSDLRKER
jgi:hypothetical protein